MGKFLSAFVPTLSGYLQYHLERTMMKCGFTFKHQWSGVIGYSLTAVRDLSECAVVATAALSTLGLTGGSV